MRKRWSAAGMSVPNSLMIAASSWRLELFGAPERRQHRARRLGVARAPHRRGQAGSTPSSGLRLAVAERVRSRSAGRVSRGRARARCSCAARRRPASCGSICAAVGDLAARHVVAAAHGDRPGRGCGGRAHRRAGCRDTARASAMSPAASASRPLFSVAMLARPATVCRHRSCGIGHGRSRRRSICASTLVAAVPRRAASAQHGGQAASAEAARCLGRSHDHLSCPYDMSGRPGSLTAYRLGR